MCCAGDAATMTETTEATPPPPAARRLFRPRNGRLVGGVAAGLGTFTDLDPVLFRVLFGVLVFVGGAGFVLYAVAWLLIPAEGHRSWFERWVTQPRSRAREWILAGLLTLTVLAVWGAAHWHRVPILLLPLAAVIVAVAVVRAFPARPVAEGPPPAPVPRSPVTLPTIGLAVFITGLLVVLDAHDVVDLSASDVLACTLGVVVLGAVAAAFLGRSRSLVATAVLLLAAVLLARPLPGHLSWSFGERSWSPTTPAQVPTHYSLGAGRATLDLTALRSPGDVSVHGAVGAGQLRVIVPPQSTVVVHAHAGAGEVTVFGRRWHGIGVDRRETDGPTGPTQPASSGPSTIQLDLAAGYGTVQVTRAVP